MDIAYLFNSNFANPFEPQVQAKIIVCTWNKTQQVKSTAAAKINWIDQCDQEW